MQFDWDDANILHLARHGITPGEAEEAIRNGSVILESQTVNGEQRLTEVGETAIGRTITLITVDRDGQIRAITGWDATRFERLAYLEAISDWS
ncbi:hypothetical protein SAMN05421819_2082 [Bryocella elongata]|uniref:Uncharacterized protein n=1 Tax=Bryocella elongata TaxID=863522 RepID=A0A1H5Y2F0_9BACT|nr:BrnT family toxin [Bryocella elongata]SEG18022.1 hypothetical protein SAMN05421819_2082 [Bryocella elongata]